MADPDAHAILRRAQVPIWVFDIDRRRVHWANAAALKVWSALSLDELCSRDMGCDMSASVAARLAQYQADFISHDAQFNEQWTLNPGGRPLSLHVHYSSYRLPDGRMAMMCEGLPVQSPSPESLRSVEALLHTPMMIALYGLDGQPLYRNPAARTSVRSLDEPLHERFADPAALARLRQGELLERCRPRQAPALARGVGAPAPGRRHRRSGAAGQRGGRDPAQAERGEGAVPVRARSVDRPAQPPARAAAFRLAGRAGSALHPPSRPAGRGDPDRPRPLQGRQRLLGPCGRRRVAGGSGPSAGLGGAPWRPGGALWRR